MIRALYLQEYYDPHSNPYRPIRSPNWPWFTDRGRDRYEAEAARRRVSPAFGRATLPR